MRTPQDVGICTTPSIVNWNVGCKVPGTGYRVRAINPDNQARLPKANAKCAALKCPPKKDGTGGKAGAGAPVVGCGGLWRDHESWKGEW